MPLDDHETERLRGDVRNIVTSRTAQLQRKNRSSQATAEIALVEAVIPATAKAQNQGGNSRVLPGGSRTGSLPWRGSLSDFRILARRSPDAASHPVRDLCDMVSGLCLRWYVALSATHTECSELYEGRTEISETIIRYIVTTVDSTVAARY